MFDVLSSAVTTNSHLLVEASAGTGKTFTIEHLFIRRLLEPIGSETVCVKEIAIVTFTKACARELSIRIRKALNTAIELLTDDLERPAPEYIEKIRKEGERAVYAAKRKLIDAKCQIDRASISTIHSFAGRLLSEYFQDESHFSEKRWLTSSQLQKIVYDYFELEQDAIATYELQILLKSHGMDIAALIQEISRSLWEVGEPKEIQVLSEKLFQAAIKTCWSEEFVLEKLEALSFQFCDCRSRSNELKPEIAKTFAAFAKLFSEKRSLEEIMVSPLLTSDQFARLKARAQPDDEFLAILRETFDPLIEQISSKEEILARQVFACKKFVTKVIRQKGFLTPQDLLLQMEEAVLQPEFSSYLKGRYRAIFVDEFQDTDPMQWKIFSDTFLKSDWQGFLYLVGDPKQAIYAFRNADIYSYMKAKNSFSEEMKVSLTSNFRSSPQLTEALNTLFVGAHSKSLFFLPELNESVSCHSVEGKGTAEKISDDKGSIHFFIASGSLGRKRSWPHEEAEMQLFSFVAQEIITLAEPLHHCAVLVKDRFQALRLVDYLESKGIGAHAFRRESIATSEARSLLLRLFHLLRAPKNRGLLIHFFAETPFSFTSEELIKIKEDLFYWASYVERIVTLRSSYEEKGLSRLSEEFFAWTAGVLSADIYRDLEHLFELLIEEEQQGKGKNSLDGCIEYLEDLEILSKDEAEEFSCRYEIEDDKVAVLTMHKSKGLEFEIVFALGVASRSSQKSTVEEDAEKLRQFYVASTRAKRRLYLPVLLEEDEKKVALGTASPIELFLTHVSASLQGETVLERDALYQEIGKSGLQSALDALMTSSSITATKVLPFPSGLLLKKKKREAQAVAQKHSLPVRNSKTLFIDSFSQSHQKIELSKTSELPSSSLPEGVEVGILLHEIITEVKDPNITLEWVQERECLKKTVLETKASEVYTLLQKVFELPLQAANKTFRLQDVDLQKTLSEAEFFYYENDQHAVRGVIDFAFEYEGGYYLIDWKSHLLEEYTEKNCREVVSRFGYERQGAMYAKAFTRYLQSHNIDKNAFQGMFFVFLRGPTALFFTPEELDVS